MEEKENYPNHLRKKKKDIGMDSTSQWCLSEDKSRSGLTRIGRIFCTVEIISGHPDVKNF